MMVSSNSNEGSSRRVVLGVLLVVFVALVGLWFFRPWLHGIIYGFYTTPVIWLSFPVVGGLLWLSYRRSDDTLLMDKNTMYAAGIVFLVGIIILPAVSGLIAANTLGHETMQASEDVDSLRETVASEPRIITKGVADRYASNTLPFSQYKAVGGDITVYNGTPYWSYALAPDGLWNYFTKEQHGTVLIDMTKQNAAIEIVTGDMSEGIGTAFYDSYRWHLLKNGEYLVNYADPFMVIHEGKQYIAVPYTTPKFHWLPLPHTTPTWGGVMLIDSSGDVTDLSPSEAREHPVLKNQKLYPFDLALSKVAATKYRNGIVNTFTSHKGQIEVTSLPGENNDQPFFLVTKKGPTYVVAAEPYGNAHGLKEVWMIDARTGEYFRFTPDKPLFGPRKAADFVRQAAPKADWNRFDPAAPLPVVINDQLYWEIRIVPEDNSGIAYIAFVNAQTSEVREVKTTAAVERFLKGREVHEDRTSSPQPRSQSPVIIVQRVAPNGTVIETMQVYENESIQIVQRNSTNTTETR